MSELRAIGSFAKQIKRVNDGNSSTADVYSVTKYDGFVRSLDYFKKQVFSRDLGSYKIVRKGEFAYSTIHLDEGALGLLEDKEALISPMYTTFQVDESVDRQYIAYLLKSPDLVAQYGLIGQGSINRRKSVAFSSLAELEVFTPPLPEQKKIAEILSGIDNAIQRLQEAIGSHDRARNVLLESIFQDGFRKAESGSDEWQIWTIEELLANTPSPMRSGPFGSALLKEELAREGIPFLGIDNVRTEEFVPSFKRFLTEAKFNELRRYEVFPRDVMITIMGTVGRACVVPEGTGQCVSSKHTWTMTFDRKKVAPEIICWQLNHFSGTRKKFLESSQGGVMDAISSQTLREIEVPIPTNKAYAENLAEQYLSSSRYQQALKAKLAKIRLLKNAVSSDFLSGRTRVTL